MRSFIKRDEFEKLSSGLFRVKRLWMTLVLSLDQIHSVELVGSGSRIPAISKKPSSLFKRELGRTVNASDMLFPKGHFFPSVKVLTLRRENTFDMLSTLRLCSSLYSLDG